VTEPVIESGILGRDCRVGFLVRTPPCEEFDAAIREFFWFDRYWTGSAWWVAAELRAEVEGLLLRSWGRVRVARHPPGGCEAGARPS
jgi:hypothetical protein